MDTLGVSHRIEQLVDHLRADRSAAISLGDVASVTEVLLSTMKRYFNSVDTAIYGEFRSLSDHIQQARSEIAQLRPTDLKENKIPRAGKELEAIVQATETATGTIMDAAEEIMSADTEDAEAYQQTVNDACMRIFEACSFQDITGQRITKVVSTLTHIEDRLNKLQSAWGPGIVEQDDPDTDDEDEEVDLLQGPALDGEGILQDEVDNLMDGSPRGPADPFDSLPDDPFDSLPDEPEDSDPVAAFSGDEPEEDQEELAAADLEPEPEPEPEPAPAPVKAAAKPAAKKPAVAAKSNGAAAPAGASSQAEIDALFD